MTDNLRVDSPLGGKPWALTAGTDYYRGTLARLNQSKELLRILGVTSASEGVVWVIEAGRISASVTAQTRQRFADVRIHLLGTVLNRASHCTTPDRSRSG